MRLEPVRVPQVPRNKAAHAWALRTADRWVEAQLLGAGAARVRAAAALLLVALVPSQHFRQGYARARPPPAHPAHAAHAHAKRDDELYNGGVKRECEDPYSFVEEDAMCAMLGAPHALHEHAPLHAHAHHAHAHAHPHLPVHPHHMMLSQPKKRGRKKKIKDENG